MDQHVERKERKAHKKKGLRSGQWFVVATLVLAVGVTVMWVLLDVQQANRMDPDEAKRLAKKFEAQCHQIIESKDSKACRRIIGEHQIDCMKASYDSAASQRPPAKPRFDEGAYMTCMRDKLSAVLSTAP